MNISSVIDALDEAADLVLAADMACSELDSAKERSALKTLLYTARQSLEKVRTAVEGEEGTE